METESDLRYKVISRLEGVSSEYLRSILEKITEKESKRLTLLQTLVFVQEDKKLFLSSYDPFEGRYSAPTFFLELPSPVTFLCPVDSNFFLCAEVERLLLVSVPKKQVRVLYEREVRDLQVSWPGRYLLNGNQRIRIEEGEKVTLEIRNFEREGKPFKPQKAWELNDTLLVAFNRNLEYKYWLCTRDIDDVYQAEKHCYQGQIFLPPCGPKNIISRPIHGPANLLKLEGEKVVREELPNLGGTYFFFSQEVLGTFHEDSIELRTFSREKEGRIRTITLESIQEITIKDPKDFQAFMLSEFHFATREGSKVKVWKREGSRFVLDQVINPSEKSPLKAYGILPTLKSLTSALWGLKFVLPLNKDLLGEVVKFL